MTYRKITGLCVVTIAALSCPVMAETFVPSHTCMQPVKPAQFRNNHDVAIFNAAVSEYKQCITAFVDENYKIADSYRDAADKAIADWNTFLNDNDLN